MYSTMFYESYVGVIWTSTWHNTLRCVYGCSWHRLARLTRPFLASIAFLCTSLRETTESLFHTELLHFFSCLWVVQLQEVAAEHSEKLNVMYCSCRRGSRQFLGVMCKYFCLEIRTWVSVCCRVPSETIAWYCNVYLVSCNMIGWLEEVWLVLTFSSKYSFLWTTIKHTRIGIVQIIHCSGVVYRSSFFC